MTYCLNRSSQLLKDGLLPWKFLFINLSAIVFGIALSNLQSLLIGLFMSGSTN